MSTRLMPRQVRTLAGASLTTSYQAIGAVVTISGYKIAIVNATTTDVQISDGRASDAYYIPAGSTLAIGEGLTSSGQQNDTEASEPAQVTYMAKLPSGSAGTGTLVITILGH